VRTHAAVADAPRSLFGAPARRDGGSGASRKRDARQSRKSDLRDDPDHRGNLRPQDCRCDRKKPFATARCVLAKSLKNNEIDRTDRTDRKNPASFYSLRAWAITLRMTVGRARSVMRSTVHHAAPGASSAGPSDAAVARATVSSR